MILSSPIITKKNFIKQTLFDESGTISRYDDFIKIDKALNNIILNLGDTFFNKFLTIKVINESLKTVRVTGKKGNFEEDDTFTLLTQTITSPASGNTLTASADIIADLAKDDTILINGLDQFTIANVAGNIITTNETITNSYSADSLEVAGLFISADPTLQAIVLFSDRDVGIWRGIK